MEPVDDGLCTRSLGDPQSRGQQAQDARDSAKAEASDSHQWESHPNQVHLGGWRWSLAFKLMELGLSHFESLGGSISLGFETSELLALIAIEVAALFGFVVPLSATVFDFGKLAHHALAGLGSHGHGAGV